MKHLFSTIAFVFIITNIYSQKIVFNQDFSESAYYLNNSKFVEFSCRIANNNDSAIVLWFNKSPNGSLSTKESVREYFFHRKGDVTLASFIYDRPNYEYPPVIFFDFYKVLDPGDSFDIRFLIKGCEVDTAYNRIKGKVMEHLVIVIFSEMEEYFTMAQIKSYSFPVDYITIFSPSFFDEE